MEIQIEKLLQAIGVKDVENMVLREENQMLQQQIRALQMEDASECSPCECDCDGCHDE